MKKIINKYVYLSAVLIAVVFSGCSEDIDPEIKSIDGNRLFSPVDLKASIENKTNVTLAWNAVNKATGYNVEIYENADLNFEGNPLRTAIVTSASCYIENLTGGITYSARVQAMGENIEDSKWTTITFKTVPGPSIFYPIEPDDITYTSVTLRWPAGSGATSIILTPGDIKYDVTADDIAAGTATISGLDSDKFYTATLINGIVTIGTISFRTPFDPSTSVIIPVSTTEELQAAIASAASGSVLYLEPGLYETTSIDVITHSISIRAKDPENRPTLKGFSFSVTDNAGLTLKDLILDGTGANSDNQMVVYKEGDNFDKLSIQACDVKNYVKGVLYVNQKSLLTSVEINKCIFSNILCSGGDFIDFRNGITNSLLFTENTVYNCAGAGRDLFRMDAGGSTNYPTAMSTVTVSQNTFDNISPGKRVFYVRAGANISITAERNIFSNTTACYSDQSTTQPSIKSIAENNYYKADSFLDDSKKVYDNGSEYTKLDPMYQDAANGDFTVVNEALKDLGIGDPRWLK